MKHAVRILEIGSEHAGRRLDNFLFSVLKNFPKSYVYRIIRRGEVRVNGGRRKPDSRLALNDKVRIPPHQQSSIRAPVIARTWLDEIAKRVVFEDEHLAIVDKPAALAVHAGSGLDFGVIDIMRQISYPQAELVHRLDRDTSGCLLVAKAPNICRELQNLFRAGTVDKCYRTLVRGRLAGTEISVDAPLETQRHDQGEAKTRVSANGKSAQTIFRPRQHLSIDDEEFSYLDVVLKTGRTHQIRVHANHVGHPVVGDRRYGDQTLNQFAQDHGLHRMYLHAVSLAFTHPVTGAPVDIQIPESTELQNFLGLIQGP
ncbi:MAG: RluA family pseudouridine synthase [Pseudomonadota bacterium]